MNISKHPKASYIKQKNKLCDLQCVMIAILSKFCSFEFTKSQKESTISKTFLKIKTITINDEVIDLEKYKKDRCEDIKKEQMKEGITEKVFHHRTEQIKRKEIVYLLEDILMEFDIYVIVQRENKYGLKGNDSFIVWGDNIIYQYQYEGIANKVRTYIQNQMRIKTKVTVMKNIFTEFLEINKMEL